MVAAFVAAFVLAPSAAMAQLPIEPTGVPPTVNPPMLDWMSTIVLGLALLTAVIVGLLYARYAPRFRRSEADDPAFLRPGIPAQSVQIGGVAARPPAPAPAQAVAVAAPAAPVAAVATAPAAPAAVAPSPPAAAATTAAAPAEETPSAPAAASVPTPEAPAEKKSGPHLKRYGGGRLK